MADKMPLEAAIMNGARVKLRAVCQGLNRSAELAAHKKRET
jgi:hypothetical protein